MPSVLASTVAQRHIARHRPAAGVRVRSIEYKADAAATRLRSAIAGRRAQRLRQAHCLETRSADRACASLQGTLGARALGRADSAAPLYGSCTQPHCSPTRPQANDRRMNDTSPIRLGTARHRPGPDRHGPGTHIRVISHSRPRFLMSTRASDTIASTVSRWPIPST